MDGQQVYSKVLEYQNLLAQLLEWAEADMAGNYVAHATKGIRDYVTKLQQLVGFLNQNTSNSLVFKKNTLNIVFKNNTPDKVRFIHKILQEITDAQYDLQAIIAKIPGKDQGQLPAKLLEAYKELNKYIDALETKMHKRNLSPVSSTNGSKHDSLRSSDLTDIHAFDETLDISPTASNHQTLKKQPRKSLFSFGFFKTAKTINVRPDADMNFTDQTATTTKRNKLD